MRTESHDLSPSPKAMREALGCFATGVAIVTGEHPQFGPVGMTISSFNSASLDPPLILWSVAHSAPSKAAFTFDRPFTISILAAAQKDLCYRFARPSQDKFAGIEAPLGENGLPVVAGSVVHFECVTERVIEVGDHDVIIGRVARIGSVSETAPLIFHRSQMRELFCQGGG